jgi:hypothetical protein
MIITLADYLKEQAQESPIKEAPIYKDRSIFNGDFDAEVTSLAGMLIDAGL